MTETIIPESVSVNNDKLNLNKLSAFLQSCYKCVHILIILFGLVDNVYPLMSTQLFASLFHVSECYLDQLANLHSDTLRDLTPLS